MLASEMRISKSYATRDVMMWV